MGVVVFDIETNGLLKDCTEIHCMVLKDIETQEVFMYRPHEIQEGVQKLLESEYICGHNIIAFDIPVIERLYNVTFDRYKVIDTLVLARIVFSNVADIDMGFIRKGILPRSLYGRHSLKAYGYRLGELKGTYSEDNEEAWVVFNEDMLQYNLQDVIVTEKLYKKLQDKGYSQTSSELEHACQWLMQKQEHNGYPFDIEKAKALEGILREKSEKTAQRLEEVAPKIPDCVFIPKKDNKAKGYVKGVPIQKYKAFNPNSRKQLQYILEEYYKYPFTDDRMYDIEVDNDGNETQRKLKLNEETLVLITNDEEAPQEVKDIALAYSEYFMLAKRLGQLADGQNAWLKLVESDGKIHGHCNPNGAVSGRATHSKPNLSQVPSITAPYGAECRELFTVPHGWYQAGIDCSGLELRCLAHFLYPYDHGSYAEEVLNGDIHTANQISAGLEERSQAKTFIYGFLYGAGNAKIGEIVGGNADDGARLKKKFLKNTPQIKKLQQKIKNELAPFNVAKGKRIWERKYLYGLDGRKLYVRSLHSVLNLLLQSAGALICKKWIVRIEERLQALGLTHGWDGDYCFMVWSHDEVQIACRTKELAELVVLEAQRAVRDTQEFFKIRIQLDTEGKIGKNWRDCH